MIALALGVSAFAQKTEFKFYGFVRNYFAFDTREGAAGTEDLYYYVPLDKNISAEGVDLNANPSFRFAALTTRLGVDIKSPEISGYRFGAKIETDFYAGLNGSTGTAQLRLRQAYATVDKGARNWKIGQAWHPMAADLPDIYSLESGAPFGPFSRTPQVQFNGRINNHCSFTAAALWQMQYTSTGPEGASANYIKYSCVPEFYLGANYNADNLLFRVGVDVLSIKPRKNDGVVKVSDRLTTATIFEYGQYKYGDWTFKEKITFSGDGSHFNLIGGYGVSGLDADGSFRYSPTRTLAGWATASYHKKDSRWTTSMLAGWSHNFGTAKEIYAGDMFWCKNYANKIAGLFRLQPEVVYTIGKLQFGMEYMLTGVRYGTPNEYKHATSDLHLVCNNRFQAMVKYNF